MTIKLPLYASHKQVRAAEIVSVDVPSRRVTVDISRDFGRDQQQLNLMVEAAWLERFQPKAGDWLMQYADGYMSVSPASAFVGGYTTIDESEANADWKPADPADEPEPAGIDQRTGAAKENGLTSENMG